MAERDGVKGLESKPRRDFCREFQTRRQRLNEPREGSRPAGGKRRPRFSLSTLMLVMLVCAFTAAAGSYLARALETGTSFIAFFTVFTLVAPILLVLGLNLFRAVTGWLERLGRGK